MKQNYFFWPSLFGAFFDDDFFGKDVFKTDSKFLTLNSETEDKVEDGYVFDFLPDVDINPDGIEISVKDGCLNVKYDKVGDGEEIHYSSTRTLPKNADINTIQASTEGTGIKVTMKFLQPQIEDKEVLNIPVKVVKPEE